MSKLLALIIAAAFAGFTVNAVAQGAAPADKAKAEKKADTKAKAGTKAKAETKEKSAK